jgi:hypothetical protein
MPNEKDNHIRYRADEDSIIIPSPPLIRSKAHFTFEQGGKTIGEVHAVFDVEGLPTHLHTSAVNLIQSQRTCVVVPTPEYRERRRREAMEHEQKRISYNDLPWYKKIFTPRPF